MSERHIKVVYFDGEPAVYDNGKILNEKEIVDLLVEYFEDCDGLINENEKLKKENEQLKQTIKRRENKINRQKKDLNKYTDYFMNELNWDCDRIIKEVFQ